MTTSKAVRIIRWVCPTCGVTYTTEKEADDCGAQSEEAKREVGDIVLTSEGHGWFDGDKAWVIDRRTKEKPHPKERNCFSSCCTIGFFYVVTFVDLDPENKHRYRYHLFTEAMTGKEGYRSGWTFRLTHVWPCKARKSETPKAVLEGAKKLIGQKAGHLL